MKISGKHKRLILSLVIFMLAFSTDSFAQRRGSSLINAIEKHDVGIFGGIATYLGDFNDTDLFYRPNVLVGLLYRYNINPYFALRGQAGYSRIEGYSKDYYGDLPGFPIGDQMAFDRSMIMVDGAVEFNFLPFSPVDKKRRNIFSPYLLLGIGANFLGSNSYNNNPQLDMAAGIYPEIYGEPGNTFTQSIVFEIPVGFGIKVSPARRLTLAGEWTFKKMFYDNIDGFTNRGGGSFSLINDDWVSTITFSLTYRFASSWKCDAYQTKLGSDRIKTLKEKGTRSNLVQSPASSTRKAKDVRKLEGRSENDNKKIKKRK